MCRVVVGAESKSISAARPSPEELKLPTEIPFPLPISIAGHEKPQQQTTIVIAVCIPAEFLASSFPLQRPPWLLPLLTRNGKLVGPSAPRLAVSTHAFTLHTSRLWVSNRMVRSAAAAVCRHYSAVNYAFSDKLSSQMPSLSQRVVRLVV